MPLAYCLNVIQNSNGLEFDVVFDVDQRAKLFFDDFLGVTGNNEIYIISPTGEFYNFEGHTPDELKVWVIELYNTFF